MGIALSELYKADKVREDQLGALAKAVICTKLGCRATGPKAVFGNFEIQLVDSLPTRVGQTTSQRRQTVTRTDRGSATSASKTQPLFLLGEERRVGKHTNTQTFASKPQNVGTEQRSPVQPPEDKLVEPKRDKLDIKLEEITPVVAREGKTDAKAAHVVLSSIVSYLAAYPSVGVLRLIDDIARKTKADPRIIRAALDVLKSIGVIEVVDVGVVNLKRQ